MRSLRKLSLLLVVTGCLALPSAASALTPPPADLAEIVFSNAGRIVSIKADGSERNVLTRANTQLLSRNFLADIHLFGDSQPAISPDRQKLAFIRYLPRRYWQHVMIAGRDGSGATPVEGINGEIKSMDWMPDGRLLLTTWDYRYGQTRTTETYRLMAVDPATGKKQVFLSKKFFGNYVVDTLEAQEVSPDGRLLLYARDFGEGNDGEDRNQLRILNLENKTDRALVNGAKAGSFSPDGDRVAFTQMCADEGYSNCESADRENGVWTVKTDGSDREMIVSGDGEYASPDWGPGGGYIIFSSSRNFPAERQDSNEIYSVRSDGECLTWLTNGSPESIQPSWAPETEVRTDPGAECGDAGRKPLAEARPPKPKETDPRPRYWAGPKAAGQLLSKIEGYAQDQFGNQLYRYGDCPYFESSKCRRAITLELARACSPIGEVRLPPRGTSRSTTRRGVKVTTYRTARGKLAGTTLRTGLVRVGIGRSMLDVEELEGKAITLADHLALIDALRPVGKALDPGSALPPPALAKCRAGKRK